MPPLPDPTESRCPGALPPCGALATTDVHFLLVGVRRFCGHCAAYHMALQACAEAESELEAIDPDIEAHALAMRAVAHFEAGGLARDLTEAPDPWTDLQPLVADLAARLAELKNAELKVAATRERCDACERALRIRRHLPTVRPLYEQLSPAEREAFDLDNPSSLPDELRIRLKHLELLRGPVTRPRALEKLEGRPNRWQWTSKGKAARILRSEEISR